MSLLAQAMNLNPIEQVLDELEWKVKAKRATNAAHF